MVITTLLLQSNDCLSTSTLLKSVNLGHHEGFTHGDSKLDQAHWQGLVVSSQFQACCFAGLVFPIKLSLTGYDYCALKVTAEISL